MQLHRATYTGLDNIMEAYDAMVSDGLLCYSVWHSQRDIAFQFAGEDKEKARGFLEDNLKAMESAGNDDLLYIKFHPASTKQLYITKKTEVIATMPVRVVELERAAERGDLNPNAGYQGNMWEIRKIMTELPGAIDKKIEEKIKELIPEEVDEEEELEPWEKAVSAINGIANNPGVMSAIGQLLGYFQKAPAPYIPVPGRINGTIPYNNYMEDQQQVQAEEIEPVNENLVNDALNRLAVHCKLDSDLQLLAEKAEKNPAQFKMLLGMLRG